MMVSACGIIPGVMKKYKKLCWPQCVLEKVVGNMIPFMCLVNPRNIVKIKHSKKDP